MAKKRRDKQSSKPPTVTRMGTLRNSITYQSSADAGSITLPEYGTSPLREAYRSWWLAEQLRTAGEEMILRGMPSPLEGHRMTEAEWLTCEDPQRMVEWMRLGRVAAEDDYPPNYSHCPVAVSDRKLRLFYLACWYETPWCGCPRGQRKRGYREGIAFIEGSPKERICPEWELYNLRPDELAVKAVNELQRIPRSYSQHHFTLAAAADLLRCLFGNPWRPVERAVATYRGRFIEPDGSNILRRGIGLDDLDAWLTWNGGVVLSMAQAIYEERRFEDMPVLSDALEEAGCADEAILAHGRCSGPHARGCWVLDLILGKS